MEEEQEVFTKQTLKSAHGGLLECNVPGVKLVIVGV